MGDTVQKNKQGFTLIELSIVLVIIGLIVGGVLIGQDLIKSAQARATVTQLERYNTAVHTFQVKFNCLPGDCANAASFGFPPRGTAEGEGDGNGVIEGHNCNGGFLGSVESCGETALFWEDLSQANLIEGLFNTASAITYLGPVTGAALNAYFPQAKLGGGNYIYVWSGGVGSDNGSADNGLNYFGISPISQMTGYIYSGAGLTVGQAYSIDTKVDDGLPQSGRVTALYDNYNVPGNGSIGWAAGGGLFGASTPYPYNPTTAATPWAATNCYDNNNVAGPETYSMAQNASQVNCALSVQFQ
jgi:prepilin-type N-terminal cleavage/methylation domain-containing protein